MPKKQTTPDLVSQSSEEESYDTNDTNDSMNTPPSCVGEKLVDDMEKQFLALEEFATLVKQKKEASTDLQVAHGGDEDPSDHDSSNDESEAGYFTPSDDSDEEEETSLFLTPRNGVGMLNPGHVLNATNLQQPEVVTLPPAVPFLPMSRRRLVFSSPEPSPTTSPLPSPKSSAKNRRLL